MKDLLPLREEINKIDIQITSLLEARMKASKAVAKVKQQKNLPIFDANRETEILNKIGEKKAPFSKEIKAVYESILKGSREVQSKTLLPKRIFLIGYMGAGKSTVGKVLGEITNFPVWDMDTIIEERQGCTIKQIFIKWGEHEFRNKEYDLLKEICTMEHVIVSCGGGVIHEPPNQERLMEDEGLVVFLRGDLSALYERVKNDPGRPNAYWELEDENAKKEKFIKLYKVREEIYERVSDVTVDTYQKSPAQIAEEIISYTLSLS